MSSHYRQIKGIRYSAALINAAEEMVAGQGDGRISKDDAEKLVVMVGKDGKYSALEKRSLAYVQENFAFTDAGVAFLESKMSAWSDKKEAAVKKTEKTETVTLDNDNLRSSGRSMTGKVVSNKPVGGKTITVEVERRVLHPKYKKIVRKRSKYRAHDESNICQINDEVVIQECRPMSKTKRWKVIEHTSAKH